MRSRFLTSALVALLSLGLGVALSPRAAAGPQFLYGHALPTNIPNVIKQAEIVQPNGSALPEPTASAYADLDEVVDVNQPATGVSCGTIIPGQCYEYQSFPLNICGTPPERAVWAPQNLVETAFTHVYPGTVSTANRYPNGTGPPFPTPCPSPASGTTNGGTWNPLDASLASYVNAVLANPAFFPVGYNLFNDNGFLTGNTMCGSAGSPATSEYGSSANASGTNACDHPGSGGATVGVDYDSAVGVFESRLNTLVFQNGGFNCCGDPTGCSSIVVGSHGHDPYYANCIDNAYAYHNAFANANGHLRYILLENAVQHKNLTGSGWAIANDVSLAVYVNTVANLVNDPATAGGKVVDSEYGFGSSGPGDLSGGYAVRTLITALRWLVPNPATGMPDRDLVMYSGVSCSGTDKQNNNPCVTNEVESRYYYEQSLVPVSPVRAVPAFAWNASHTPSLGYNCDNVGDSGGVASLVVQCVGNDGILEQQYQNLCTSDHVCHGPLAIIVNTSNTSEPILSSWFKTDLISSFHYSLALSGAGTTSVPFGAGSIALPCTYAPNCGATFSLGSQTTAFNPNSPGSIAGKSAIILTAKNN